MQVRGQPSISEGRWLLFYLDVEAEVVEGFHQGGRVEITFHHEAGLLGFGRVGLDAIDRRQGFLDGRVAAAAAVMYAEPRDDFSLSFVEFDCRRANAVGSLSVRSTYRSAPPWLANQRPMPAGESPGLLPPALRRSTAPLGIARDSCAAGIHRLCGRSAARGPCCRWACWFSWR